MLTEQSNGIEVPKVNAKIKRKILAEYHLLDHDNDIELHSSLELNVPGLVISTLVSYIDGFNALNPGFYTVFDEYLNDTSKGKKSEPLQKAYTLGFITAMEAIRRANNGQLSKCIASFTDEKSLSLLATQFLLFPPKYEGQSITKVALTPPIPPSQTHLNELLMYISTYATYNAFTDKVLIGGREAYSIAKFLLNFQHQYIQNPEKLNKDDVIKIAEQSGRFPLAGRVPLSLPAPSSNQPS